MKLEFQKCLSAMDRCLVLPHAVSRAKVHSALAARRREGEEKLVSEKSFLLFFFNHKKFFSGFTRHRFKLPAVRCFPAACLQLGHGFAQGEFIATCINKFVPLTLEKKRVQK